MRTIYTLIAAATVLFSVTAAHAYDVTSDPEIGPIVKQFKDKNADQEKLLAEITNTKVCRTVRPIYYMFSLGIKAKMLEDQSAKRIIDLVDAKSMEYQVYRKIGELTGVTNPEELKTVNSRIFMFCGEAEMRLAKILLTE